MKLARKLTIGLATGILLVMSAYAYFQVRREIELSEADLQRARHLALGWLGTIEAVWRQEGAARAYELTQRANERATEVQIRLLPFDAAGTAAAELSTDEQRVLEAGEIVRRIRTDASRTGWRQIYVPLTVNGTHPAFVEYVEPMIKSQTFIQMSHRALALATFAVIVVCGLIAIGLQYWLVGRPLQLLGDKARRAGAGDFSTPLLLRQKDEIGELARELNAMCAQIADANNKLVEETEARMHALEQLRHTDRLATVGQLAAGVAHELGTPLSVISARAEMIERSDPARTEIPDNAHVIVEQCERMTAIIQQLLDFSRRGRTTRGLADLRHVATRALDLLRTVAKKARVDATCEVGTSPVLVRIDQNQIQQALTNLILNGIQAMPHGGRLSVRVTMQPAQPPADTARSEGEYACVTIADQGIGIRAEDLPSIFEPFFTTKDIGSGTGLGLPVTHGIVTEHGGWIAVDSTSGSGTCFSIFLPLAAAAAASAEGVA